VSGSRCCAGASAFLNGAAPGGSGLGGAINVDAKRAPNEALNEGHARRRARRAGLRGRDIARRFGPAAARPCAWRVRRDGGTAVDDEKRRLSWWRSASTTVSGKLPPVGGHRLPGPTAVGHAAERHDRRGPADSGAPERIEEPAQPWNAPTSATPSAPSRRVRLGPDLRLGRLRCAPRRREHRLSNPTGDRCRRHHERLPLQSARATTASPRRDRPARQAAHGQVGHTIRLSLATLPRADVRAVRLLRLRGDLPGDDRENLYAPVASAPRRPRADRRGGDDLGRTDLERARRDTLSLLRTASAGTLGARQQRIEDGGYDQQPRTPVLGAVFKRARQSRSTPTTSRA
jgi:iron complex outermembrane receptor protein